jgi:hypothetical protein
MTTKQQRSQARLHRHFTIPKQDLKEVTTTTDSNFEISDSNKPHL